MNHADTAPNYHGPCGEHRRCLPHGHPHPIQLPRSSVEEARLVFTTPAAGVTLLADPDPAWLLRGEFSPDLAWVGYEAGVVALGFANHADGPAQEFPVRRSILTLYAGVAWSLEFRSAVYALEARLGGVMLRSLDALGPVASLLLELSVPVGGSYLYFAQAADLVTLRRPAEVGVGVDVQCSLDGLRLDGRGLQPREAGDRVETAGFAQSVRRIEISLAGLARQWMITVRR